MTHLMSCVVSPDAAPRDLDYNIMHFVTLLLDRAYRVMHYVTAGVLNGAQHSAFGIVHSFARPLADCVNVLLPGA